MIPAASTIDIIALCALGPSGPIVKAIISAALTMSSTPGHLKYPTSAVSSFAPGFTSSLSALLATARPVSARVIRSGTPLSDSRTPL